MESDKGPGKAHRNGMTLLDLMNMFPNEATAREWFEGVVWGDERACGHCGSLRTSVVKSGKPMPYRCKDCRKHFSVKTGTALACSNLPLRTWALAIYLCLTNLKSISSMKLHRDLGVTQKTAWFMLHRIRESWLQRPMDFKGPVEVDETFVGGLEKNKHPGKKLHERHREGKATVVGLKDRGTKKVAARVIDRADMETLVAFVEAHTGTEATVYTDDMSAYKGLKNPHETVKHSVGEFVRGMAHTNGVESFWSMLKRAHKGTFHKLSAKHLQRYVNEFAGKQNIRERDTIDQMVHVVAGLVGRRLIYRELVS